MSSYVTLRSGENASSKKWVDPHGENLTEILEAFRTVEDAISHGVTKTRSGELRAGVIAGIARYINPLEQWPTSAAGLIAIDDQYIGRNIRKRSCLEKKGIPASDILRLPQNDETAARTTEGMQADFSSADFTRSVAALNKLNETQFAMINNDIIATIGEIFEVRHLLGANERAAEASGLILLGNLRIQVLSVAARSANYTSQILDGAKQPRKSFREFQDMLGLIECALRREAMVNKQPTSWASEDVLRRITQALAVHTEAMPTHMIRLRHKLTEAAGKIDTFREAGQVTFDDIRTIYLGAYRSTLGQTVEGAAAAPRERQEAEVVFAAQEYPRNDR